MVMATIKDVARLSQTSVGTVSRYLNGHHVKSANRARIEDAIRELDFSINPLARGLRTNKTKTVGVLIPELANNFSIQVMEGMEQTLDEHGYSLIICDSRNNIDTEREKLKLMRDKLVDGIILMPVRDEGDHIRDLLDNGLPVVLVDRLITNLSCDGVVSDSVNGAYRAVATIINRGHKRIGIIAGPQNVYTARERLEGYLRALKDYNIQVDESLVYKGDYTLAAGSGGMEYLLGLEDPPSAVFVSNYHLTLGALKAITGRGMTLGADISFFGYDQLECSELIKPPVSVVVQAVEALGRQAAELLVRRMKGDLSGFPVVHRLKTEIVVTDSVKKLI